MRKSILALAFASLFTGTAMARGDIEVLARTCNNCHGVGGVSAGALAHIKESSREIRFDVTCPPDREVVVTYRLRVHYS